MMDYRVGYAQWMRDIEGLFVLRQEKGNRSKDRNIKKQDPIVLSPFIYI
ncbi:MAG: hypothetical protein WA240_14815 [Nitrospirota bacterium]